MNNITKRISFLFKMPFFGILLVILILAMAMATFIESAQGTNAAWALIYDTWWFELLFILVIINLLGNIVNFNLYKRSKLTVFIFHVAFIFIIIGGGITRYMSSEGMMHIREGDSSNSIVSNTTFMDVMVKDGDDVLTASKKVRLSVPTPRKFKWTGKINDKKISIKSVNYMNNARAQYIPSPGGDPFIKLIVMSGSQFAVDMLGGEFFEYPGISLSFNKPGAGSDLNIYSSGETLTAFSKQEVTLSSMGQGDVRTFAAGDTIAFEQGKVYLVNGVRLALQNYMPSVRVNYVQAAGGGMSNGMAITQLEVKVDGMKSAMFLKGQKNMLGEPSAIKLGSTEITCTYGSREILLPFSLKLKDFRIDRYPGSNSPSSFESDVVLIDEEQQINEVRNIYMNNVLKHRGYRFYQSSYDRDEHGTVLSVKKDFIGTTVSYIGYLLLTIGMILALFAKGTRFSKIARSTATKNVKVAVLLIGLLAGSASIYAQGFPAPSKDEASAFGKLWVQGKEGRFKPMNTLSSEMMRKVIKKSTFEGKNADQVMLGMITYPDQWKQAPIFEVENPELQRLLNYGGKFASFNDFVTGGRYLLSDMVDEAYKKRVQDRNDLDKEVMKLDEKINVFYLVQTGDLLKIFPDPNSPNHTWYSVSDMLNGTSPLNDTLGQVFFLYTQALREHNDMLAQDMLNFISNYQVTNTSYELHEGKKKAEIVYNRLNVFDRLAPLYGIFGLLLLIVQFLRVFNGKPIVNLIYKVGAGLVIVFFGFHTVFFIIRWWVSGHAPLSNGYESMIFVSWITILAGLIFARRTGFAISLTSIFAALALLVAHMSWMNPEITNLVPVLKSPWLTIHVTVIMAGYGFLGLSMFMGLTNLGFFAALNRVNRPKVLNTIDQLTKVNQLALVIGLYFLTIGTFLGGVWANESWGRYWGWDPKETWALISVLVYSFVTHMHRFPGMKGNYAFNLASVLGYFSILMTYFGVNYFLGGIHSYAGGIAFEIPVWVYIVAIALFSLSLLAYNKQKQFYTPAKNEE